MHTWKWGGALLAAAAVAAIAALQPDREEAGAHSLEPSPRGPGLALVGYLEAPGIDLARCEVRCASLRLEEVPVVHRAPIGPDGRFEFTGLADEDYRVEVVVRSNPALVVARREFVRPGGEALVLESTPAVLFGPASSGFDAQ
ncbi:MAG TPA: hypothetical protein VF530_05525 [Planctomycetota bacterium]